MKFITVDVGNTSTAVGLWSSGRVSCVSHFDDRLLDAFETVERLSGKGVQGVAYLSVVPKQDKTWRKFVRGLKLPFHQISHKDFSVADLGLSLDYPKPETIGADRLCWCAISVRRSLRRSLRRTGYGEAV